MKKAGLMLLLLVAVLVVNGCETAKGAAVGVGVTAAGTAKGAVEDSKSLWGFVMKTDAWLKKHAW